VMRAGRFEQVDTAENLLRMPETGYVADFFKASEVSFKQSFARPRQ